MVVELSDEPFVRHARPIERVLDLKSPALLDLFVIQAAEAMRRPARRNDC